VQALEAGQVCDEVGGQSGGKVALLGVAADVLEGQLAERGRRERPMWQEAVRISGARLE
jgi:hypothetical protein